RPGLERFRPHPTTNPLAHCCRPGGFRGADDGNRTRAACLGSRSSTIELHRRDRRFEVAFRHKCSTAPARSRKGQGEVQRGVPCGAGRVGDVLLSDRDLRAALAADDDTALGVEPFDPEMVQPSSIDVRLDKYFRVFNNSRYTHIDPKLPQEDLTSS